MPRWLDIKHDSNGLTNWEVIHIEELTLTLWEDCKLNLIVDLDGAPYGTHFEVFLALEGHDDFEVLGDVTHIQNKILLISD